MVYLNLKPKLSLLKKPSVILLILTNCIPIVGVLFFGWDLFSILFLYWAETAIIGFFSLIKMVLQYQLKNIVLVPFFVVHFGIFMAGHLIFLITLFANPTSPFGGPIDRVFDPMILLKSLTIPFIAMWISHTESFVVNYLRNTQIIRKNQMPMLSAYARVIVMHITIILGSILSAAFNHSVFSLVILVVLKTIADLYSHIHQHRDVYETAELGKASVQVI